MMAEEASTIRNFLGHASDHKDKAVGYPTCRHCAVTTTCSICGSAGGITVAYDGKPWIEPCALRSLRSESYYRRA